VSKVTSAILQPKPLWQKHCTEYITSLNWSKDGTCLAWATAAGEVWLWQERSGIELLQATTDQPCDVVAFAADSQWLSASGQDGKVHLWQRQSISDSALKKQGTAFELVHTIDVGQTWVDQLAWHPTEPELAFALGKYVQVWRADSQELITTLAFDQSTVMAVVWHPTGDWLTVGGYQGIKVWQRSDWYEDPVVFELPTATGLVTWDHQGKYLALGTLDQLVVVMEWLGDNFEPSPWRMQGFPGKIRSFAWSAPEVTPDSNSEPLLISCSGADIVVWRKHPDPDIGWDGNVLRAHLGTVTAVAFQPQPFQPFPPATSTSSKSAKTKSRKPTPTITPILASAGKDGRVNLWHNAQTWRQAVDSDIAEITTLTWQPQGKRLAAGNSLGTVTVWAELTQGKGFI
jgi:WD40 repeat protein